MEKIAETWAEFFKKVSQKDYSESLGHFLKNEYDSYKVYPAKENIFNAFKLTSIENLKVVILGQDPYHEVNQAHGLAFSVLCEKLPPSLVNIYKEMASDLNVEVKQDGNLEYLAKQGVLLLNSSLTVVEQQPMSHNNK